ncbi:MAG: hypothetical protein LBM93_06115 [Oscillospiraceae bacterium]|nr:hypothetical protein [Oscillospiraceae bacterium]
MKTECDGSAKNSMFSAGDCRNKADWLIGMNLTRFYTSIYGNYTRNCEFGVLTFGRCGV